jgi:hypothetical protein
MLPLLPVNIIVKILEKKKNSSFFLLKKGFEGEIDAPNAGVMKI